MRLDLSGQQVAHHDAGTTAIDNNCVDQFGAIEKSNSTKTYLTRHLLVCANKQLLSGLTACIKRAANLCAAKTAVVEQAAVLACERHALGNHLVDDVN